MMKLQVSCFLTHDVYRWRTLRHYQMHNIPFYIMRPYTRGQIKCSSVRPSSASDIPEIRKP